ncbi:type II toxin-antitoxin system Phd/YefM family antitoxin [soil metagenome]
MVKELTATRTKATLLAVLDEVETGEVVRITRHGRVVAELVPARGAHALRGRFAGEAMSAASDDDLFSTGVRWDLE